MRWMVHSQIWHVITARTSGVQLTAKMSDKAKRSELCPYLLRRWIGFSSNETPDGRTILRLAW